LKGKGKKEKEKGEKRKERRERREEKGERRKEKRKKGEEKERRKEKEKINSVEIFAGVHQGHLSSVGIELFKGENIQLIVRRD
jgi:hypothetical protein